MVMQLNGYFDLRAIREKSSAGAGESTSRKPTSTSQEQYNVRLLLLVVADLLQFIEI